MLAARWEYLARWLCLAKVQESGNEQFPIDLLTNNSVIDFLVIAHSARRVVRRLPMAWKKRSCHKGLDHTFQAKSHFCFLHSCVFSDAGR